MDAAQFSGTEPLKDMGRIDLARLTDYVHANVPEADGALRLSRFKGGQSNPTLLIETGNGRSLVLRKKPDGDLLPSAHAVDREFRVMSALRDSGVPVPRTFALCDDPGIVGSMFFLMEHIDGRAFWNLALPELASSERTRIYGEIRRVIATLHSIDPAGIGLSDFGRPGNYFARQVARWSKQYRASETERIEAMDHLIEWLPKNLPPERSPALLHGDYRIDNMIFAHSQDRVVALLDWELSTIGDPVADFAYHMLSWHLPPAPFRGLEGLDLAALGIPDEAEYRDAYFQKSGLTPPDEREWSVYLAYSLFRVAAIRQGIMRRVIDGTASSSHAREAGALARPVAELALHHARRADRH